MLNVLCVMALSLGQMEPTYPSEYELDYLVSLIADFETVSNNMTAATKDLLKTAGDLDTAHKQQKAVMADVTPVINALTTAKKAMNKAKYDKDLYDYLQIEDQMLLQTINTNLIVSKSDFDKATKNATTLEDNIKQNNKDIAAARDAVAQANINYDTAFWDIIYLNMEYDAALDALVP